MVLASTLDRSPIVTMILAGALTFVVVVGVRAVRPVWFSYRPDPPRAAPAAFWGTTAFAAATAFIAGQALAVQLYGLLGSERFDRTSAAHDAAGIALSLTLALVIAPLSEEALCRGAVYPLLRRRLGIAASVGASTLVFAALHGNLVQAAFAAPVAVVLALVYERTRSLWPAVALHALVNIAAEITPPAFVAAFAHPLGVMSMLAAFGGAAWLLAGRVHRAPAPLPG